ncbi:hypothetical protein ACJMK2_023302 [Sinanodonta woodiana]|uniref:Protein disulfide-isomerase n=1 Tax=Sinanodonta woodiana TaxID=1069815 RepID=A0ABD3T4I6_SINWO
MKLWLLLSGFLLLAAVVKCDEGDTKEEDADAEDEEEKSTEVKEEEDVLVLDTKNFDEIVYSKDTVLVEFYAPWCGHCKSLAPEYAKAAKILKESQPPISLAKVDATVETELGSRFDVSGYPTLKWFKKGEVYDYDGPREANGIVSYMKERADPSWKPPPEVVVSLTKDTFDDFIQQEISLVEFYAPWCGHCKKLAPEYEKAAKQLIKQDPPIPLAKVDATAENELASKYGVTGYPTIKIFRKGRAQEYKGPRDEMGIVNHMISQSGEASKMQVSLKDLQQYMAEDAVTIIGFFDNLNDPRLRVYMDAANDLRDDFKFGHTLLPEALSTYKVNPGSVVVFSAPRFFTKYEPKWNTLHKGEYTTDDVSKFIQKHKLPLVGEYQHTNEKFYKDQKPLCLFFYTVDFSFDYREATQLWRNKIAGIANKYKNDITFAVADEEKFKHLVEEFGLDDSGEELNIGCYGKDGKRYPMEPMEEFESDEVREFLDKLIKGKLKPHIKSQPIPKKKEGPVTVVVGQTFDKIVKDKTKDVLIEMYAPWCGHCKQLEPKYLELAKKYKKEKNLVIAKIDATANDVPEEYRVEGFPTVYFAPSNRKDTPLKYDGPREVEDFSKYLEEHATVSFGKSLRDEL